MKTKKPSFKWTKAFFMWKFKAILVLNNKKMKSFTIVLCFTLLIGSALFCQDKGDSTGVKATKNLISIELIGRSVGYH